jgi:hypothetical protein
MATGLSASGGGGIMAPADVRGAGEFEWATVAGVPPTSYLVGGPTFDGDVDRGRSRIVTTPDGQVGPATGGLAATPDGSTPGVELVDTWRDLFNFRGSPMPWLLVLALVMLGFMQFRLSARGRAGRARGSGSLALG